MPNSVFPLPALLERIDTNLASLGDVGVEDLGHHGTCYDQLRSKMQQMAHSRALRDEKPAPVIRSEEGDEPYILAGRLGSRT